MQKRVIAGAHVVSVLFSFITVFQNDCSLCIPISNAQVIRFLHPCQHLVSSLFFNFSYSERCVEASDCSFNLHFTDDQWSLNIFSHLFTICTSSSVHPVLVFLPVFYLGCSFSVEIWDFFGILNTSPLSDMWCPAIFSQSIIYLRPLHGVFLLEQKIKKI